MLGLTDEKDNSDLDMYMMGEEPSEDKKSVAKNYKASKFLTANVNEETRIKKFEPQAAMPDKFNSRNPLSHLKSASNLLNNVPQPPQFISRETD